MPPLVLAHPNIKQSPSCCSIALPGMLTGTIIGMAQALGETAPLNDRNGGFYCRHTR